LFTLPIWWLIFRKFKHWKLLTRIGLTLLLLPIWAKGWQQFYYWTVDTFFNGSHLGGAVEWWDIYIPALFYFIQFGIFYGYEYHWNLRRSEQAEAESARLALSSELSALKAQLNPHFLYNAFNAISASVPPGQEATRELIAQLSDMFRYQLRAARADEVPFAEEIDFVNDYLTLEKARFGDRLRVAIEVPESLKKALVPPLLIQPLVENAVRHGISPLLEGGNVTILASEVDGVLRIEVLDTGVGLSPEKLEKSTGFGLLNTRRRLQLLFNQDLLIEVPAAGGTRIVIEIPLKYVAESSPDRRRSSRPQIAEGIPGQL
jgi:signal transduction histidine kinase